MTFANNASKKQKMYNLEYHNPETEYSFLGGCTLEQYHHYITQANEQLFTEERLDLYKAMVDCFSKHGIITFDGIKTRFGSVPNELIVNARPPAAALEELIRLGKKRELKLRSDMLSDLSKQHDPEYGEILKAININAMGASHDSSLTVGAQNALSTINAKRSGNYKPLKTGFSVLDKRLGGEWRRKNVYVIGAEANTGKTALLQHCFLNMAREDGNGSLFLSLEMSKEDLMLRWVSNMLGIDYTKLLEGNLTDQELEIVEEAFVTLQGLPLYVVDSPRMRMEDYGNEIRKHVLHYGISVVGIDYLQICKTNFGTNNKNTELGLLITYLKDLAKDLNIAIIVLSQITTSKEGIYSIRDSGDVVNAADAIIIMSKVSDDLDSFEDILGRKQLTLDFGKGRYNKTGKPVLVQFIGAYQRFESINTIV